MVRGVGSGSSPYRRANSASRGNSLSPSVQKLRATGSLASPFRDVLSPRVSSNDVGTRLGALLKDYHANVTFSMQPKVNMLLQAHKRARFLSEADERFLAEVIQRNNVLMKNIESILADAVAEGVAVEMATMQKCERTWRTSNEQNVFLKEFLAKNGTLGLESEHLTVLSSQTNTRAASASRNSFARGDSTYSSGSLPSKGSVTRARSPALLAAHPKLVPKPAPKSFSEIELIRQEAPGMRYASPARRAATFRRETVIHAGEGSASGSGSWSADAGSGSSPTTHSRHRAGHGTLSASDELLLQFHSNERLGEALDRYAELGRKRHLTADDLQHINDLFRREFGLVYGNTKFVGWLSALDSDYLEYVLDHVL